MHIKNSVPSVESIQLMTIIEAKMRKNEKTSKYANFIRLSALSGLESKLPYIDCNLIKGFFFIKRHFKLRIQALKYSYMIIPLACNNDK